ncbi:hypothetical protein ACTGJ9_016075 [Bradyrhizobium sp. RDM12]
MSYYPAALAKELLPTLLYLEAAAPSRSAAGTAVRCLASLIEADAFPSPESDESYAACLRIAHDGLRGEIENDPCMDSADCVVADFLLDVLADNQLRSVFANVEDICAMTGVMPEDAARALCKLCGGGYFRAIRPSKLEQELGIRATQLVPQLDDALLNQHLHRGSAEGASPDQVTLRGRRLVTYCEDQDGNLQVQRPTKSSQSAAPDEIRERQLC